jgi:hypothetical protein
MHIYTLSQSPHPQPKKTPWPWPAKGLQPFQEIISFQLISIQRNDAVAYFDATASRGACGLLLLVPAIHQAI